MSNRRPDSMLPSRARRNFLGVCGGSVLLAHWLRSAIARAEGATKPKRIVLLHRPNGSIAEDWISGGMPGPILQPFSAVWPYAVAVKGVDVRPSNGSTGGSHEAGLVTIMTGARLGSTDRTNDDYKSTAESLDQTLVKKSPILGGQPVKSLQLGAHGQQDGGNEVPNCTMSYSGAAMPLYPILRPDDVYKRLFGDLIPGGTSTPATDEALVKARARRQSVLGFVKWDLARVRAQFPADLRADLDTHEGAIAEAEKSLGGGSTPPAAGGTGGCSKPTIDAGLRGGGDYNNIAKVGAAHLKLVTAAFACDLTRVVTFQWATGASLASFGPLGANNHHSTSHANSRKALSTIDRWYSERTASFIQQLVDTPDVGGGKLIDNTLVWYLNEVSEGWSHSFNDYPFVLFGGDGVGLRQRGRVVDVKGMGKTSNDIWTSLAPVFGTTLTTFGTKASGPIPGLFT